MPDIYIKFLKNKIKKNKDNYINYKPKIQRICENYENTIKTGNSK